MKRNIGFLLLIREFVFYIAFYVLASSINWPESLGLDAESLFPLIFDNSESVHLGYYTYLIASILYLPIFFGLRQLLMAERYRFLLDLAVGFLIVSVVMRVLGILRWLFAMPYLAQLYMSEETNDTLREIAVVNYYTLDAYAGVAGEVLGLQIFGALFIALFGFVMLQSRMFPKFLGYWALLSAVLFLPLADMLAIPQAVWLTINGITFSLWTIALGIYLLIKSKKNKIIKNH